MSKSAELKYTVYRKQMSNNLQDSLKIKDSSSHSFGHYCNSYPSNMASSSFDIKSNNRQTGKKDRANFKSPKI